MIETNRSDESKKVRVVVADDHAVLRAGLRLLINTQADMETIGEAGDFGDALRVCRELRPDVVSLDLNMPGGTAAATIETLVRELPELRVLVLTMHDDAAYLKSSLAAGAHGFVVKKSADTELLSAIRALAQGRAFVDLESIARPEVAAPAATSSGGMLATLSEREREVLGYLVEGHTNRAISEKMGLSIKTVESYRARVMTKLECRNRADLMRRAQGDDGPEPPTKPR